CTNAAADFFLHHLTQCLAAAPDRREKDNHIVHASAQRCADQDPERTRQKSKLRCQYRPHQRPRTSDRCKMMPENHPTIRWHIILAIVLQDRRRGSFVIEHQYFCSEPFAVKTVADAKRAKARHNDPKGTDLLAARERQNDDRPHPYPRNGKPEQLFPGTHFASSLIELVAPRQNLTMYLVNAIQPQN